MKVASRIVRAVFLVVALLSYTENTQAATWYYSCNTYCTGNWVRIHDCEFADYDHLSYDTCNVDAANYFGGLCNSWAAPYYFPWFGVYSCDDSTGDPTGNFWCSYEDPECIP